MNNQEMLESAIGHHRAGRVNDAASLYWKILADEPDHPDALNLLGMLAHQIGDREAAERLIGKAIAAKPGDANYHFNFGLALMAHGRMEESVSAFRQATILRPNWPEAFNNLGSALQECDRLDQAIACFARAIALQPDSASFYYNLGNALTRLGRMDQAASQLKRAIALRPDYAEAYSNLSNVLYACKEMQSALAAAQDAARLRPDYPEALNNLGSILLCLERREEAIRAFERAIALRPDYVDARNNLANALVALGQYEKGTAEYGRALMIEPNRVDILCNLSAALLCGTEMDAALDIGRRALALQPDEPSAWQTVAAAHQARNELDEAIAALHQALAREPAFYQAHTNLGNAFRTAGRLTEAIECFARSAELSPDYYVAASNRLFCIQFHPDYDAQRILAEHRLWDEKYAKPLRNSITPHGNDPSANRRLRIGYVSPDFRAHCQALFTEPLLSNHDHEQFEIFCYSSTMRPDGVTERLKACADAWRRTGGKSDAAVAEMIREDRIDVLVDLTMHMADCRPLLMARKPAPVQVAWLAYPGTTGLATMDYRLTDPYLDPETFDDRYTERSIRLADTFWCYDALGMEPDRSPANEPLPEPAILPATQNGFVTFGCLNDFTKINDGVVNRWARTLRAVPGSRLRLLAPRGDSRQRLYQRMAELGVSSDRVEFVPRQSRRAYLQEFNRIDICLDTLPYNGHTTSLDSFWMGVPVITQVGNTVVGRAGWSQLSNLGLAELAAIDEEAFLRLAIEWSGDLPRLAELRRTLRPRMSASPLCDGPRFARSIEAALRTAWRQWCAAPR